MSYNRLFGGIFSWMVQLPTCFPDTFRKHRKTRMPVKMKPVWCAILRHACGNCVQLCAGNLKC